MEAADVLAVLDHLEAAGVASWLDGGWGVDALVGERTRAHDDLDLVVARDAVAGACAAVEGPRDHDRHDLRLLSRHFGIALPPGL